MPLDRSALDVFPKRCGGTSAQHLNKHFTSSDDGCAEGVVGHRPKDRHTNDLPLNPGGWTRLPPQGLELSLDQAFHAERAPGEAERSSIWN